MEREAHRVSLWIHALLPLPLLCRRHRHVRYKCHFRLATPAFHVLSISLSC